jgi:hypothetical protein
MKKIFSRIVIAAIFVFAFIMIIGSYKSSEAAITAWIDASATTATVGDPSISIGFGSDGADSCTVTLNGSVVSTSTSGNLTLPTSTPGTYTYHILCRHLVEVDLCATYGGECSSKFINDTICYTLETKSQCQSNSSCQWLLCAVR